MIDEEEGKDQEYENAQEYDAYSLNISDLNKEEEDVGNYKEEGEESGFGFPGPSSDDSEASEQEDSPPSRKSIKETALQVTWSLTTSL